MQVYLKSTHWFRKSSVEKKLGGHGGNWQQNQYVPHLIYTTVKPVLSGHTKIEKTKILMTNGSLMKVKSVAECSPWSILQYF